MKHPVLELTDTAAPPAPDPQTAPRERRRAVLRAAVLAEYPPASPRTASAALLDAEFADADRARAECARAAVRLRKAREQRDAARAQVQAERDSAHAALRKALEHIAQAPLNSEVWARLGMALGWTPERTGAEARKRRLYGERYLVEQVDQAWAQLNRSEMQVHALRERAMRTEVTVATPGSEQARTDGEPDPTPYTRPVSPRAKAVVRRPHPVYDLCDALAGPAVSPRTAEALVAAYYDAITSAPPAAPGEDLPGDAERAGKGTGLPEPDVARGPSSPTWTMTTGAEPPEMCAHCGRPLAVLGLPDNVFITPMTSVRAGRRWHLDSVECRAAAALEADPERLGDRLASALLVSVGQRDPQRTRQIVDVILAVVDAELEQRRPEAVRHLVDFVLPLHARQLADRQRAHIPGRGPETEWQRHILYGLAGQTPEATEALDAFVKAWAGELADLITGDRPAVPEATEAVAGPPASTGGQSVDVGEPPRYVVTIAGPVSASMVELDPDGTLRVSLPVQ